MIAVSGLAKDYGDRTLFQSVSFQLNPGERYGLVGANGAGKSTLLNILSGREEASSGSVSVPRDVRLGVLRQDHFAFDEETVLDVALMGNQELFAAMREKAELLAAAERDGGANFDTDRFGVLEETVQRFDGYSAEARASTILEGLGLPTPLHRKPLGNLSGGFKLRVLLAQVLASQPDVLLLDEPTNHLDIVSIRWLEKFLQEFSGPLVVISHDHRFLDNVATRILDVDYETVIEYPGDYTNFLRQKVEERERREKEIEAREKEIAHHQEFVDRFRAKASKARQAQSKVKLIEKRANELVALPQSSRRYPTFRFEARRPSGKEVLRLKGIRKSYGPRAVLHGVDLEIARGDRVAIMGPNGIGKSTLLKIANGVVAPDSGEVEWGYETHVGYFAQDHKDAFEDPEKTSESWLWGFCPGRDRGYVRAQMGMVLFSGEDGAKKVGALSGGEAARLVFARIAMERPNVLVLDEPTNHLDLEAIEALVEGLQSFQGTLVVVSHDRWFVSRLATRVVEIREDGITDYRGTYEEYVHHTGDDHLDVDKVLLRNRSAETARETGRASEPSSGPGGSGTRGGSGRSEKANRNNWKALQRDPQEAERREAQKRARVLEKRLERVTADVESTEARMAEIDALFLQEGYFENAPAEEIAEVQRERSQVGERLDGLMTLWETTETELAALRAAAGNGG
jgi:ATPase subunit of ABC transporter with duplicated ATPase domains